MITIHTIAEHIAHKSTITVYCNTYGCHNSSRIDLEALEKKLDPDHGCLHWELLPHFHCSKCRKAGRPDKNLTFIHSPDTSAKSGNPYLKAKGG